jgi:hypothetical protein
MSISVATDRLATTRRRQHRELVTAAVLLAVALVAVIVAITVSSSSSSHASDSARPSNTATLSNPATLRFLPTSGGAAATAPNGYVRDPITHAVLPLPAPIANQPGPGHK